MAKYEIDIDTGKPYTEEAMTLDEVKAIVKRVYDHSLTTDYPVDFKVYREGKDISEYPVVRELVDEVISGD